MNETGYHPPEDLLGNSRGLLLRHSLFVQRAIGRLRRRTMHVPDLPVTTIINGRIRFEHQRLPFLTEENLRAMISNTYDINLCEYLRNHLSAGDIVLDAGANIGYISAVAASYVGPSGEVHGFEPLAECYARLQRLAHLNPGFRLIFHNVALGNEEGVLSISCPGTDARNATLVPGKNYPDVRPVQVMRLDDYIFNNIPSPERIRVIKIDVQGFEYPVLRGLEKFFARTRLRPLIACDMKPFELPSLGHTIGDLEQYMRNFGYAAYHVVRDNVPMDLGKVRDFQAVLFRVS